MRVRMASGDTPVSAFTGMASSVPASPRSCWAVSRSKLAVVDANRSVTLRTPVMTNSRTSPWNRTLIGSPGWKPSLAAVTSSITTSPGPTGARPATRMSWAEKAVPTVGRPEGLIGSPSLSTSSAKPMTWPHTLSTPGMAAMTSSSDSGRVSRSGRVVAWAVNWALARTTTSIWADELDACSKAASMVSVRTNVPDTRLTASATAEPVRTSRLRWARSPFSTRHISRSPRSDLTSICVQLAPAPAGGCRRGGG